MDTLDVPPTFARFRACDLGLPWTPWTAWKRARAHRNTQPADVVTSKLARATGRLTLLVQRAARRGGGPATPRGATRPRRVAPGLLPRGGLVRAGYRDDLARRLPALGLAGAGEPRQAWMS